MKRTPDFENLRAVLNKQKPSRPTLFEFFMNNRIYEKLTGLPVPETLDPMELYRYFIKSFAAAGYDYATVHLAFPEGDFFPKQASHKEKSISLNEMATIQNRSDFDAYPWFDLDSLDYSHLDKIEEELPDGLVIQHSQLKPNRVDGRCDHRIVMALALAGLALDEPCTVETAEAMNVTFPNFVELMTSLGAHMELVAE